MAICGIAITGVSGQPQVVLPSGCRTIVTVSGTVTTPLNMAPCPAVMVTIKCQCGTSGCSATGGVDSNGALIGGALGGYLVNGQWQIVLQTSCCCDSQVDILASCPAYSNCQAGLTTFLHCNKCCPVITIEAGQGPCDDSGQSTVTFTVKLDFPAGCPPVTAYMDFGDGSAASATHSFTPPSSAFTWTHVYSSGTWLAQVVIAVPDDCPGKGKAITVNCPKADCCPELSMGFEQGECDADGNAQVTLSIHYSVPDGCPPAEIQVDFGHGPLGAVHTISGSGTIVETRLYPSGSYSGFILVHKPRGCPAYDFPVQVKCPTNCCPTVSTNVEKGPCRNGALTATFFVNVAVPAGCPPVVVQLDFGDGSQGVQHSFAGSGSYTETHAYQTGNYSPSVDVIAPAACPSQPVPAIAVQCPLPDCCPEISTEVSYGECDGAGNAVVTIVTTVTPKPAPCPPAQVQVDFGGGDLGPVHTFSSPGSFTETRTFSAGPHSATVNVLTPAGCRPYQVNIFVPCRDCCPNVSVSPCIPDCGPDPDRTVEFQISVSPKGPPCPPKAVSFQMDFGDGSQGQSVTIPAGGAPYSYTETHTYSGADALQDNNASLTVSQPPECAGSYGSVVIPACCKKRRANLCRTLLLLMSWSFALALLFLLFWLLGGVAPFMCTNCAPFNLPASNLQYFFYGFAIAGVLLLIGYLLLCTKCLCGWVFRLLWRVLFGAGLLYAIHAGCGLQWLSVLIGALLILLAFFFLRQWRAKCCVSECDYLQEILFWFGLNVLAFATFLLANGIGAGCQFVLFTINIWIFTLTFTVLAVAAIVFSLFGAYYLRKCK